MNIVLENKYLKATISTNGAELTSVIRKEDGREIIWTGDKKYWGGHAPILFPACGGLWNGTYTLNGKEYKMPKHGFAKTMEWNVESHETSEEEYQDNVTLYLTDNDNSLTVYPFHFTMEITYRLVGNSIECLYTVRTEDEGQAMPFQIGGHPSVMLVEGEPDTPIMGYLQPVGHNGADVSADILSLVRVGEQGCWRPERYPVPSTEDGLIPICVETFHNEALIIDRDQIAGFRVLDRDKHRLATVRSNAPVFLIWQPQDLLSPFVCVEPWYGLCDLEGHSCELIERPYSQCALPGNNRWGTLFSMEF